MVHMSYQECVLLLIHNTVKMLLLLSFEAHSVAKEYRNNLSSIAASTAMISVSLCLNSELQ
jgi:hypothetical protein